jgi:hypothetical protein
MTFKLHAINVAAFGEPKSLEVTVQVSDHFRGPNSEVFIGKKSVSKGEFDAQVEGFIRELKKLRYPKG